MKSMPEKLATEDWALLPDFLVPAEIAALQAYWSANESRALLAKVSANATLNPEIRGDRILWLNGGDAPAVDALFARLHQLRIELNRELFLNLHDFEAHLAFYPPGSRYQAHYDQPRKRGEPEGRRLISMVIYLNSHWREGDGGELILWADEQTREALVRIEPLAGRAALFRSADVFHEVALARAPRLSITVWFRRLPTTGLF